MIRKNFNNIVWRKVFFAISFLCVLSFTGCTNASSASKENRNAEDSLRVELRKITDAVPGKVGIAVINPDGDTITINNDQRYQMMSVFKLHEAIAVSHVLDMQGISLDTIISFSRTELNPDTWSPMLKEHPEEEFNIPVSELLRYIIQSSDNNASNLLFDRIVSTKDCDGLIRKLTGITDFAINYTEREMHANHSLADGNYASPLSCALLMEKVFTDSILSTEKQNAIQEMLLGCQTGQDRLYVPLREQPGTTLAHKTGSGFRNDAGELMAHNDVGRITLPNGRSYVLAVMVKDFNGTEEEASAIIARIATVVFDTFNK